MRQPNAEVSGSPLRTEAARKSAFPPIKRLDDGLGSVIAGMALALFCVAAGRHKQAFHMPLHASSLSVERLGMTRLNSG